MTSNAITVFLQWICPLLPSPLFSPPLPTVPIPVASIDLTFFVFKHASINAAVLTPTS